MITFILVRHGFSMGNKNGIFTGQMDVPLTEEGYLQAEIVSEYIEKNYRVDAIYSSDLSRAVDTVKPLAQSLGLAINKSPHLREMDTGLWTGKPFETVIREQPEQYDRYKKSFGTFTHVGGEDGAALTARVSAQLEAIAGANDGKTVVIGTHAGVVRRMCAVWLGLPPEKLAELASPGNASVTVVNYDGERANILLYGYNDFLNIQHK